VLDIDHASLDRLAGLLQERAGLKVNPDAYYALKLALRTRMPVLNLTVASEYLDRLRDAAGEAELRSLLPLVTVGKTEFFRDSRQFAALERRIFPELLRVARRQGRTINIWSAGCATGEEPYSLAMLLLELGAYPQDVRLRATDINLAAIEHAKQGLYSRRQLFGLSPERLERHFKATDQGHQINDEVKAFVTFEGMNLAARAYEKVAPDSLDVILCRNVIIYFDLITIQGVMDRFAEALRPTGLLLLGYSESLFKVYDRFEITEVEGAFMYRRGAVARKEGVLPRPGLLPAESSEDEYRSLERRMRQNIDAARARTPSPVKPSPPPAQPAPPAAAGWTKPLAKPSPAFVPTPSPVGGPQSIYVPRRTGEFPTVTGLLRSPTERLDAAVRQMDEGKFDSALAALKRLCADEPNDLDAGLTLGNLESVLGHAKEAEAAFAGVLAREPLCVDARIFNGMALMQSQRLEEARGEFSRALFLDPTLALGHYLLAQAQERLGSPEGARKSYRNVLEQLKKPQRPLAGHYPDQPTSTDAIARAARYALAALEEA
jgi:chemotaxis protein methyltransferase CheR